MQDDDQERGQAIQPDRRSCRGFRSCSRGKYFERSFTVLQIMSVCFLQQLNPQLAMLPTRASSDVLAFGECIAKYRSIQQGRTPTSTAFVAASKQVRTFADVKASPTEVSSILEQRIRGVQEEAGLAETGRVLSVGCVALVHGKTGSRIIDGQ